jgi:hypothetical protein
LQEQSKVSLAVFIILISLLPWSFIQQKTHAQTGQSVMILITDAIEDLQNGDTDAALTHSNLALQELSSTGNSSSIESAQLLLNDAIRDLENDDTGAAQTHLNLASQQLGVPSSATLLPPDIRNATTSQLALNPCPDGNYDGICDKVSSSVVSNTCNDNNFNGICEWYYDIKQQRLIQKQYDNGTLNVNETLPSSAQLREVNTTSPSPEVYSNFSRGANLTSSSGVTNMTSQIGNQTFTSQQPFQPQSLQNRINWLEICMNPLVDYVITEPCSTLTTPDGYTLTSEGDRVLRCLAGGALVGLLAPELLMQIRQLGPAVNCAR